MPMPVPYRPARTVSLSAALVLFFLPFIGHTCLAAAQTGEPESVVAPGISAQTIEADLPRREMSYLHQLMQNDVERLDYLKKLYTSQRLEEAVAERGLDRSQPLLSALHAARARVLLDSLVDQELEAMGPDIESLARERYEAHPDRYQLRKKIKLAIIFIKKGGAEDNQARSQIERVKARLEKEPDNPDLFGELAKEHSQDKWAKQGGMNDKWLIAPVDLQSSPPMVQAAFALKSPGQLTDIVETEQGFAIAKLIAVTPAAPLSFEQAKDLIVPKIRIELEARERAEILKSLQPPADFALTDDAALQKMISEEQSSRAADKGAVSGGGGSSDR
jgi:parvulin-like peptidyl-prolyl isomerase